MEVSKQPTEEGQLINRKKFWKGWIQAHPLMNLIKVRE
jgi:hypothetical protein